MQTGMEVVNMDPRRYSTTNYKVRLGVVQDSAPLELQNTIFKQTSCNIFSLSSKLNFSDIKVMYISVFNGANYLNVHPE